MQIIPSVIYAAINWATLIPTLLIVLFIFIFIMVNVRVVPQASNFVVERLGAYKETWETGLHVKIPFIDRVAKSCVFERTGLRFCSQAVITKDNVTMQIDTVLFTKLPILNCMFTVSKIRALLSKI